MEDILDNEQIEPSLTRRRSLLPLWIKIFLWIFLVMGFIIPIIAVIGLLGGTADLAIYGLATNQPFSILGIFILLVFLIKGITAFGLWTEKDWAVNLAIIDAGIGSITCFVLMFVLPVMFTSSEVNFEMRMELIALIPYAYKMIKIKPEWVVRSAG